MKSGRPAVVLVTKKADYALSLRLQLLGMGFAVMSIVDAKSLAATGITNSVVCILVDADEKLRPFSEVAAFARSFHCSAPLIALCKSPTIPMAVALIKSGATDIVETRTPVEEAASRIRALVNQTTPSPLKRVDQSVDYKALTAKEREVLWYVLQGLTSKEIGAQLGVSHRTVSEHRSSLLKKTQARNVAELAQKVKREAVELKPPPR